MSNRMLEKSVNMGKNSEGAENLCSFELEYYLLESVMDHDDHECTRTVYGIEILKRMYDGSIENKKFEDIYTDKGKTRELISVLAANTVTPITLPYILDDLLSE
jgi:hypothetical protein